MFDKFPKINYNFNGKEVEVTDIFRNVKVDFTNFSDYKIVQQTNSRPDQTAATVYDDPNKFWLMFLTNNVNNPFVEWQETAGGQYGIDKTVYDTKVFQFANSSAYRPTNAEYYSSNITDRYLGVDFSGIQANDIITFEKGDGPLRLKCFGAGQVKTTDSVCGAPHYGQSIIPDNFYNRNGVTHISAGGNVTAVLDSVGRMWAWGEDIGLDNAIGINFGYGPDLYFSDQVGYTSLNTTKNKILASRGNVLYCFGNGCTGIFPQTLNETIKKIAFLKGNTYGGVVLNSNNTIQLFNGLTASLGSTGYLLCGTTFSDITCTEQSCFGLINNGTRYSDIIVEFNNNNSTSNYIPNTLIHHMTLQFDGRLVEKNTVDTLLYTVKNHSTNSYIRNTNYWTNIKNEKLGLTGIDLTCISVWNSASGDINTATAISPIHVISAQHFYMPVGTRLRFVTNDNQVVERTTISVVNDTQIDPNGSKDWRIFLLDSPLPSSIKSAKIFPANVNDYFPKIFSDINLYDNIFSQPNAYSEFNFQNYRFRFPVFYTDQEEKGLIADISPQPGGDGNTERRMLIRRLSQSYSALMAPYFEIAVNGDSSSPVFAIVNNELVLIGTILGSTSLGGFLGGPNYDLLNSCINLLGGGYTLSYINLSSFTKFTEYGYYADKTIKIEGGYNNLLALTDKSKFYGSSGLYGFGDNSKGQLNFPQKTNYVSMSAGKYHTAITDIHGNLNVYGQIFTNSGGCTGVTVYTAATAAYGSYGTKISSGDNHIVALESGKNVKYTGRIVKLDSDMKRIYVRGISGPPVYIKDPGGTQVIITKSDGLGIKRTIQHQLRSIDLYKNTPIYVRDQGFVINMSDNSGQQWNNIFIDNYQNSENDVRFITPVKLQKESFISGLKVLDFTKLYSLQNTIEPLLTSETKINIKMSEL